MEKTKHRFENCGKFGLLYGSDGLLEVGVLAFTIFALFILDVLAFTIIAATYHPDNPDDGFDGLHSPHPSTRSFSSSTSSPLPIRSNPHIRRPAKPPSLPPRILSNDQDCHNDCSSSSSVINNGDIEFAYRQPLQFDLVLGLVGIGDGEEAMGEEEEQWGRRRRKRRRPGILVSSRRAMAEISIIKMGRWKRKREG